MAEPGGGDVAYLAEFETADALRDAIAQLADRGVAQVETYSPVPIPRSASAGAPRRRTRLPVAVCIAGVLGGAGSYALQWYANVYAYPLNIGGRPAHAIPAFMIPTFEGTILAASFAAFFGFFFLTRLPALWHPVFEIPGFERATVDRYWLAVGAGGFSSADGAIRDLLSLGALRVERIGK
jgi:hypothetical protein